MKTIVIASLTGLALALSSLSCGQLSPEKMAEIDRQREEAERQNPVLAPITIGSMEFNSTGSVDLRYVATYNSANQVFTFLVTRANTLIANRPVTLQAIDNPVLHDAMLRVFTGQVLLVQRTSCDTCSYVSDAFLTSIAVGTPSTRYRFPVLTTAAGGSGNNLMEQISTYVLNRM